MPLENQVEKREKKRKTTDKQWVGQPLQETTVSLSENFLFCDDFGESLIEAAGALPGLDEGSMAGWNPDIESSESFRQGATSLDL
ncbi:MAG: hypothetical protein VX254_06105, partial [Planctomycetota bacterium]|nr:hypothetical protein [Planctomycetota bacterium]